jgi:hypothetical protein
MVQYRGEGCGALGNRNDDFIQALEALNFAAIIISGGFKLDE